MREQMQVPDQDAMSDSESLLSRFIGGVIPVGGGLATRMFLGLLGTALAARILPVEAFGAFVLVEVIGSFLTQFSSLGLDVAITKFITGTDDGHEQRQLVNTAIQFRLLTIILVSLVALLIRPVLSNMFGSSPLLIYALFVPLLYLLESSRRMLRSILQGFQLFGPISISDLLGSLVNFVLLLILVLGMQQGVFGLLYARVISSAAACIYLFRSVPIRKQLELNVGLLKQLLAFGFPLQINAMLTFAYGRTDALLIGVLLGPAEIAYYEVARKIPESLVRTYDAFRTVYFPLMSRLSARGEQGRLERVLNHSTRWISFLGISVALVTLVFGSDIIRLLFSDKYLPSAPVFTLLMFGLTLTLIEYTLGNSLVAIGESDKPAIVNAVLAAVSLLCNVLLIPIFGIFGAAIANVTGNVAAIPLDTLFLRRKKVDVRMVFFLKPILLFAAFWAVIHFFYQPEILLEKIAVVGLFLLASVLLSTVHPAEIQIVFRESGVMARKFAENFRR
jgi:O-antigen/teichoic acid export membrane protein